jgi:hypothetical protein
MTSLEYCIEHAPELAQEIVNAWATSTNAAHADNLTHDFKIVLEQASEYLAVRRDTALRRETYSRRSGDLANDKELQALLEEDAAKEHAARIFFGTECKKFRDGRAAREQGGSTNRELLRAKG